MSKELDQYCQICKRRFDHRKGKFQTGPPTRHHLVPKQKYHGKWKDAEIILICRSCHKQIHSFFTHNELKHMSIDELQTHPKVKKWVSWIQKR